MHIWYVHLHHVNEWFIGCLMIGLRLANSLSLTVCDDLCPDSYRVW